ncbi:extracellular solute-binding protein [Psychromonas algicola]|uniref:extracellular solute-binding protein n=1 Tax=Psychromonas algicola TaxID=2555642 RepID=UPI001067E587|nr:extracellular solute-binding protein [Psychromonas sp. RZ5]TEW47121.1 ABC transporter substrate-binding protein [Psychromonas sp. RZ5]
MKRITIISLLSLFTFNAASEQLPADLDWISNQNEPLFASEQAKQGGTLRSYILSFPQTLRTVGPDSNGAFRSYMLDNAPALVSRHPNTLKWIPGLATSWAYGKDDKTVYFKLNPAAKWSDGEKVTADDYLFILTYYRSKDIVAPWYNEYYTTELDTIVKYDDYTIAVKTVSKKDRDNLMIDTGSLQPRPKHFFKSITDKNKDGMSDNFVRKYNFKAEPTTAAYYIDKIKKGKSITFKHVDDWWGYSNRYNKNRYNVEKISFTVIRDNDIARKHFEKGLLDTFGLILPDLWHNKADTEPYQKGYIHKFWGYNQLEEGAGGLWMNVAKPLLSDLIIREGIVSATDYDGMIKNVLRGDYSRKPHAMGTGHGDYDVKKPKPAAFEPEKAAKLFAKAGFDQIGPDGIRQNSEGKRLSFSVTYGYQTWTPRIAYLKEQAKKAGLEFTMNLVDGSSSFKYMLEKKHELAFLNMGSGSIPAYWEYFHSDNANKAQTNNFTNFSSPELDAKIMAYKTEFDLAKKQQISRDIQAMVTAAHVIAPGYMVPYDRQGYWRWVKFPKNAMTRKTYIMFDPTEISNFWIDLDEKKATLAAMKDGKAFEPVTFIDRNFKL